LAGDENITSCWWLISGHYTDRTYTTRHYYTGQETISEKMGPYTFAIGPQTFFQNNTAVAGQCFDMIKENISGESVLDAYCGCGVIGIYCSEAAQHITGIDKNAESIEMARSNAQFNTIANVEFREAAMEEITEVSGEASFDTVIIDPPRAGIGRYNIHSIESLNPRRIIYMSCNPESQAKDIRRFQNYKLTAINGFDMFPQTNHVETVAVLERT
jgi:23S rRNA (uracil1939-C5)-methyltransferase